MGKKEEQEMHRDERIEQTGQLTLTDNKEETSIHLLTIIGEIEGHDNLGSSSKTTKYEHILPQLAAIEDSKNISGLLVLLNLVFTIIDYIFCSSSAIFSLFSCIFLRNIFISNNIFHI